MRVRRQPLGCVRAPLRSRLERARPGGGYFDRLPTQSFVESRSVPAIDHHTTPALARQFNGVARTRTRGGSARVYAYEGLNGAFLLVRFLTFVRGMLGPSQVVQARHVAAQDVCEDRR